MLKLLLASVLLTFSVYAQDEAEETAGPQKLQEIGLDGNFSASSLGGTAGLGLKYGFVSNEKVVAGPSFRYQRTWSNTLGIKSSFHLFGGGAFLHYRLYEYFFLGAEVEFISTPFVNGFINTGSKKVVPIGLIGGGFSKALGKRLRLNAGIMYDIIDNPNSPLRQGYFMRNKYGTLLPVIYRVAFFIPLNYDYTFMNK